jgi:hypothetical protein
MNVLLFENVSMLMRIECLIILFYVEQQTTSLNTGVFLMMMKNVSSKIYPIVNQIEITSPKISNIIDETAGFQLFCTGAISSHSLSRIKH